MHPPQELYHSNSLGKKPHNLSCSSFGIYAEFPPNLKAFQPLSLCQESQFLIEVNELWA